MGDLGSALVATVKGSWELPVAPANTVRRFADSAGPMSAAVGVILILAAVTTAAEPVSVTAGWSETQVADYSLPNLIAVFLENAALSLAALAFAIIVARLLGAQFATERLTYARLAPEGFAVVSFALYATAIRNFPFISDTWAPLLFLVAMLALVIYTIWLGYCIGAGLASSKAAAATAMEFLVIICIVVLAYSMGETG